MEPLLLESVNLNSFQLQLDSFESSPETEPEHTPLHFGSALHKFLGVLFQCSCADHVLVSVFHHSDTGDRQKIQGLHYSHSCPEKLWLMVISSGVLKAGLSSPVVSS